MPAYNAEAFIADSIQSVILQTYPHWELIVVDDGSTDQTAAVIKKIQLHEPRIKYIFQKNGKQAKARNTAIAASNGQYIAFLDADDLWTPDKLALQVNEMQADENIDLLFSNGYRLNGDTAEPFYAVAVKDEWTSADLPLFISGNQIPVPSVLVKKQVLTAVNGFAEAAEIQNCEDYHLWLKLLINGCRFKSVPLQLFYYRVHAGQSTYQNTNTSLPVFYTLADVFFLTKDAAIRKLLIEKLKWYVFKKEVYKKCLQLFSAYLKTRHLNIFAVFIKHFLVSPTLLNQKIAFKMISIWG